MDRPDLFDIEQLALRRARAVRAGFAGSGDFLHHETADLIAERLGEIKRDFKEIAVVGSGGGVYARVLAAPDRRISQVEPAPEMAALCPGKVEGGLDPLPLEEGTYDLVISGLWLHWSNDPVGQLVQMRRALRPDGLMIAALFGGRTLAELRAALAEAEVEVSGGLSPRVAPMGEIRELGALLQRAGYAMPVADSVRISVSYETVLHLMRDLRAMGETNIQKGRTRRFTPRLLFSELAMRYPTGADGRISATFEIVFLTGWAPAPDQPQPLRPGSATARLADALGTRERPAGERAGRT